MVAFLEIYEIIRFRLDLNVKNVLFYWEKKSPSIISIHKISRNISNQNSKLFGKYTLNCIYVKNLFFKQHIRSFFMLILCEGYFLTLVPSVCEWYTSMSLCWLVCRHMVHYTVPSVFQLLINVFYDGWRRLKTSSGLDYVRKG